MANLNLLERLKTGKVLVSDGATGTNLQQVGMERGKSAEDWVLENPQAIMDLETQFIEAGSDIILTCTFGATRLRLAASGLAYKVTEINQKAVALAKQAIAERDVLLAGSIGPTGSMLQPLGPLSVEDAQATFSEQAKLLVDGGVDLLVIETQFDLVEARAAIEAVRSLSDLPLVVSFSYDRGKRTMMGVSAKSMLEMTSAFDVGVLGINCGRNLDENLAVLKELRSLSDKPIWFKPNAGLPEINAEGKTVYKVTPEMMGIAAREWILAGANIIGGCCGTSPAHLRQIALAARQA
jgi:5-methyltetrahydrofolate--homocysteine methyltransferase